VLQVPHQHDGCQQTGCQLQEEQQQPSHSSSLATAACSQQRLWVFKHQLSDVLVITAAGGLHFLWCWLQSSYLLGVFCSTQRALLYCCTAACAAQTPLPTRTSRKMSPTNAKALNTMRQRLKKHNTSEEFADLVTKYRCEEAVGVQDQTVCGGAVSNVFIPHQAQGTLWHQGHCGILVA